MSSGKVREEHTWVICLGVVGVAIGCLRDGSSLAMLKLPNLLFAVIFGNVAFHVPSRKMFRSNSKPLSILGVVVL